MSIVNEVSNHAAHAQAAYANIPEGATSTQLRTALQSEAGGFTATQAAAFAEFNALVIQYNDQTDPKGNGTSLSATVFRAGDGALTLAIRGTLENIGDLLITDLFIAFNGAGYDQIVALRNWWLRAANPSGSTVSQYLFIQENDLHPDALPVGPGFLTRTHDAIASGELSAPLAMAGGALTVVGHSLGVWAAEGKSLTTFEG